MCVCMYSMYVAETNMHHEIGQQGSNMYIIRCIQKEQRVENETRETIRVREDLRGRGRGK